MDKWITASDITNWVATQSPVCQRKLPELIRRLIFATATSIDRIEFPADNSVTIGGWDGRLETIASSPHFPNGTSGWEMGVEASSTSKANSDYTKRTKDSLGLNKKDSTFVFVTPRLWTGKKKWETEKKAEKKWKNVRGIAADDLETWIASAPAVALWLAKMLNKINSTGIRGLEELWEEWSLVTNPVMTSDIVIAGRMKEMDAIHTWINQSPSLIEVQGDSPDEAFAFLYASITKLLDPEQVKAFSRCIVVDNIQQMRDCIRTFSTPLIIACPADCVQAANLAISKGHHVFLSVDSKTTVDAGGRALRLSRPKLEPLEKALKASGLNELDAKRHLRNSGRSISVLHRRLSTSSTIQKPAWVDSTPVPVILSLLLAGAWNGEKEADQNILEKLSEMKYSAFNKELAKLLLVDDSPVRHVGSVWMLKSPLDTWFLIRHFLNEEWLKKFEQVVHTVLTETDPKYDLTPDKRWAASMYGKSSKYSEWVRKGLVESLTILAVYGDDVPSITGSQLFVDSVVANILSNANKWEIWASLKDVMPLIAEASPKSFLEILSEKIEEKPSIFVDLMKGDGVSLGECRHAGLLWALESLSWNPEYFFRSVNVLISLAKIDPGSGWSNSAGNSLKDLFLPALPQTNASPKDRLVAFDTLSEREPDLAWKFAESYMHGGVSPSYQFRWRDNGGSRTGLDTEIPKDHNEYIKGLLPRLEKLSYATKNNLIEAVHNFINVTDEIRQGILRALKNANPDDYTKEESEKMRANIRSALNWLNSFGEGKLMVNVAPLNKALKHFEPKDILEKVGWLVGNPWARMPEGDRKGFETNEKNVLDKRKIAARELLDKVPLADILNFSKNTQYVWFFGDVIGRAIKNEEEESTVLDAMLKNKKISHHLISGFAQGRIAIKGKIWVSRQIVKMKDRKTYTAQACALLYLGQEEGGSVWKEVKQQGVAVEKLYWKEANGFSKEDPFNDSRIAIEKFLDVDRPEEALKIAGNHREMSISSELLQRLLMALLSTDPQKKMHTMDSWYIEGVFQHLHEKNELSLEEIAKLEWPFIKVFDNNGRNTLDLAIYKVLQKDPSFFTQLVGMIWKRDDHKSDPKPSGITKEQQENMASNAWEVLHHWRLVPGFNSDGSVDQDALFKWVETARKQCSEIGKLTGCDIDIGTMLSRAPADPDGIWPHVAVRNLIEKLKNKTIERHIPIGIYNSRGVTSRGMGDGGNLERDLSSRYLTMSRSLSSKWPRTAAVLQTVAESYQNDAKRWDVDSDLNDLRFG